MPIFCPLFNKVQLGKVNSILINYIIKYLLPNSIVSLKFEYVMVDVVLKEMT